MPRDFSGLIPDPLNGNHVLYGGQNGACSGDRYTDYIWDVDEHQFQRILCGELRIPVLQAQDENGEWMPDWGSAETGKP